jgi:hypothetical protein
LQMWWIGGCNVEISVKAFAKKRKMMNDAGHK